MTTYWAHSLPGSREDDWEPLADHLHRVADGDGRLAGAAQFAAAFGSAAWGRHLGLWHDLGKYSAEFQTYLRSTDGPDAHLESSPGKVDHSTAGAQLAHRRHGGITGRLLADCIAGHHAGMPDNVDPQGGEFSPGN